MSLLSSRTLQSNASSPGVVKYLEFQEVGTKKRVIAEADKSPNVKYQSQPPCLKKQVDVAQQKRAGSSIVTKSSYKAPISLVFRRLY